MTAPAGTGPRRGWAWHWPGLLLAALLALSPAPAPAPAQTADRIVRFTAEDWPPFTGPGEPGDSIFLDIVTRALALRGYGVEVTLLPWKRAIEVAQADPSYVGVLPVYLEDLRNIPGFFASVPVMTSPLGLAERADNPVRWNVIADLAHYRLGTVLGYANTAEFDDAVATGKLDVEPAPTDAVNLERLAAGRIDAAVVDANAFEYLLEHEASLRAVGATLRFNGHVLAKQPVSVAFRQNALGRAIAAELAAGLKSLDPESLPALAH